MSQLYFMEVFINDLNLDDQIIKDSGESVFVIKINVIDFPTFQITRQNLSSARISAPNNSSRLDFRAGQACHFTIPPEILAKKILKHPFSVKIFRQGDSFPMCLAELPLSGCLCDQVSQRSFGSQLPKPFVFGGTIALVDIGGNPSGDVDVTLRLTCQGRYVLTSYVLEKGCFLFRNDPQGAEYRIEEVTSKENGLTENRETTWQLPWEDFMRDVAGIFPSAGRLSAGKPPPREPLVPLSPPGAEKRFENSVKYKKKGNNKKKKK